MKLFITGATGVLGEPVTRQLIEKGYTVKALSRSENNRLRLTEWGATPVNATLFKAESLASALSDCEAVLHLATKIPRVADMKKPGAWTENDRIRRDGMRAIVTAASQVPSVHTIIYPSVSFLYADSGDRWIDSENASLDVAAPMKSTLDAEADVAAFAGSRPERRGVVLRFGSFYGPGSADSRQALDLARKGLTIGLARRDAYRSMIWIADAASAIVHALENAPSGLFDVVEAEPFTQARSTQALAQAVGRRSLFVAPKWLLRFLLPGDMRRLLARSQRVSNRRFCEETGWNPSVPSQQEGWALMCSQP